MKPTGAKMTSRVALFLGVFLFAGGCPQLIEYQLTVAIEGQGVVKSSAISSHEGRPVPFTNGTFSPETPITLTAEAADGHVFAGWAGVPTGYAEQNPLTLTLDSDMNVTAVFRELFSLAVTIEGEGTVTPSDGVFEAGTTLTLRANPASGWLFDHWEGDVSGISPTANITVDTDVTAAAVFSFDLDGQWLLDYSNSPNPTCLTITGGKVTSELAGCVEPVLIVGATEARVEGCSVTFSYRSEQTLFFPDWTYLNVEGLLSFRGTIQDDGTIAGSARVVGTYNGVPFENTLAFIMTRL
jgi:hypothetical protein